MLIFAIQQPTAAGTQAWAAPSAGAIVAVDSNTGGTLSTDPSFTVTNLSTPSVAQTLTNLICQFPTSAAAAIRVLPTPVHLEKGESVFVAFASKGTAFIYFEPDS